MKITNNIENNSINHSHIQNAIHSLSKKIKNIWQNLCNLFTQHKHEITISSPITFQENPLYEGMNEAMNGRSLPPIPPNMDELVIHENPYAGIDEFVIHENPYAGIDEFIVRENPHEGIDERVTHESPLHEGTSEPIYAKIQKRPRPPNMSKLVTRKNLNKRADKPIHIEVKGGRPLPPIPSLDDHAKYRKEITILKGFELSI